MTEDDYLLGRTEAETRRLVRQAAILRPITCRLLREAGLGPGMKVLDLGTGAGDVALLAAEIVGLEGQVIAVDVDRQALEVGRERARRQGLTQLEFDEADILGYRTRNDFDLVVGRYILVHQQSPTAVVSHAASLLTPGGRVAFHEPHVIPNSPLGGGTGTKWTLLHDRMSKTMSSVLPHWDAGPRMCEYFVEAGLDLPALFCDVPVTNSADPSLYEWTALTYQSLLPALRKLGLVPDDETIQDVDELVNELSSASRLTAQPTLAPQYCGWAATPPRTEAP